MSSAIWKRDDYCWNGCIEAEGVMEAVDDRPCRILAVY